MVSTWAARSLPWLPGSPIAGKRVSTKDGRLEEWKEIAGHLARDVRTAIRWERERGLPAYRVPGGQRGSVYAFRVEIDHWRSGNPPAVVLSLGSDRSKATGVVAVMATILLAMGAVAALISTAGRSRRLVAEGRLGRLDYARGRSPGATTFRYRSTTGSPSATRLVRTVPLSVGTDGVQDELVCFSSVGEVIWHRTLEDTVTFRGGVRAPVGLPLFEGHALDGGAGRRQRGGLAGRGSRRRTGGVHAGCLDAPMNAQPS